MAEKTIRFFYETSFRLTDDKSVARWIERTLSSFDKMIGNISYIFMDDEQLLALHKQHLGLDTYTDILTFDLSEDNTITADIYISIDRVKDNARQLHTSFTDELHRVMIHGILHLLGYEDNSEEARQGMRSKEDYCLSLREF